MHHHVRNSSRGFLWTTVATALHAASASFMVWGYNKLNALLHVHERTTAAPHVGGQSRFLTIQALFITCITMLLALGSDLYPSSKFLKDSKRMLLMLSLPVSVLVTSVYWSLLFFSPHLILPPRASSPAAAVLGGAAARRDEATAFTDKTTPTSSQLIPPAAAAIAAAASLDVVKFNLIPLPINIALHLIPLLASLADFLLFEERAFSPFEIRRVALLVALAYAVGYGAWVEYCSSLNGSFPYPFLTISPLPVRMAIYICGALIAYYCFRGINKLHTRARARMSRTEATKTH